MIDEGKWWHGPLFLKQDPTEWPENRAEVKRDPDIEVRRSYQETEQVEEQTFLASASEDRLKPQKSSSWSKLARVTARGDRFTENCRLPADLRREGSLKPHEVASSERRYIRQAQQEVFAEEIRAGWEASLRRVFALGDPLSHHPAAQLLDYNAHNQART